MRTALVRSLIAGSFTAVATLGTLALGSTGNVAHAAEPCPPIVLSSGLVLPGICPPVFDPSDPIADPLGDPDVPGPGEIAPENPGQAGGEDGDCGIDGTCPEVTVPPTTTVEEPPAEVRGETAVPVGELAFTGSGDTLVRLGAVLAIGGVAAVASAAAARKHRED